jgi:hypothetical protein
MTNAPELPRLASLSPAFLFPSLRRQCQLALYLCLAFKHGGGRSALRGMALDHALVD